jgi:hypothetical protein
LALKVHSSGFRDSPATGVQTSGGFRNPENLKIRGSAVQSNPEPRTLNPESLNLYKLDHPSQIGKDNLGNIA